MGFLIISILVAIATATSVYIATTSIVLAFVAYTVAGTITLISAFIAEGLTHGDVND